MLLIKYQKLLVTVCISLLMVFSVGSLFIHNEQQVVAQTSVGINSTDLDSHEDLMKLYNNSNFGVSMKYFTNWTQAPVSIVEKLNKALNQNVEQSLPNVRFITFFFPNNASLPNSTSFIGLAVSN